MHDIRLIRDDPDAFDAGLARRAHPKAAQELLILDERIRDQKTAVQTAASRRNELSKKFGEFKRQGLKPPTELQAEIQSLKHNLPQGEKEVERLSAELKSKLEVIPNIPFDDVPEGADEDDNVEVSRWGDIPSFGFEPKEHADFAPALGMEFETGARISGARFTFLRGGMARLHRALGQFMLNHQVSQNGYTECAPPLLVRDEAMYGTDKLPKFAEDSFQTDLTLHPDTRMFWEYGQRDKMIEAGLIENGTPLSDPVFRKHLPDPPTRRWLIPTAEVSLTASVMGELLDEAALPLRMTALTDCFRSEAGAAGRDTRGFIRQHQFTKCELVSVVKPEDSEAEHERMTRAAQDILEALGLPYRTMLLCTGDMGFGARKTYDLEVWLPGQNAYREISSCSNTGDFQARRMNTRYRVSGEKKKTEFVHTLNGSGLAVGRTLVAVLENYHQADGSVIIPPVLQPYMGGIERLTPEKTA
ncbi:MAG: serine--tRNA ligase [Pseudomonadota bacterium]